jgi:hypothetical protein
MNELLKFFRPELVNRFDEVIVFEPLKFKHMLLIVELQFKSLTKLLEEQEIGFSITEEAKKSVVREGFDPIYGARPLKRAIQKLIENPISELIIQEKVKSGNTIIVDYKDGNFLFNVEKIILVTDSKEKTDAEKKAVKKEKFTCQVCANNYESEVVTNSTPICSVCGSKKVTPISNAKNVQKINNDEVKTPTSLNQSIAK